MTESFLTKWERVIKNTPRHLEAPPMTEPKLRTTPAELLKQSNDAAEYGADIAADYLFKAADDMSTLLAENADLRAENKKLIHDFEVNIGLGALEDNAVYVAIPPKLRELSERAEIDGGAWVKFYLAAANFVRSLIAAVGPTLDSDKITTQLCEDCPPVGYPTDATRCIPCPRRLPGEARPSFIGSSSAVGGNDPVGDSGLPVASPDQEK